MSASGGSGFDSTAMNHVFGRKWLHSLLLPPRICDGRQREVHDRLFSTSRQRSDIHAPRALIQPRVGTIEDAPIFSGIGSVAKAPKANDIESHGYIGCHGTLQETDAVMVVEPRSHHSSCQSVISRVWWGCRWCGQSLEHTYHMWRRVRRWRIPTRPPFSSEGIVVGRA